MDTRLVHTRIWEDTWFSGLKAETKLLFIYCLTNKEIHMTGAYEKSIKTISFHTGLAEKEIVDGFKEIKEKILYLDGYVFVINAVKYQNYNKESASPRQKQGFQRELDLLPDSIKRIVLIQLKIDSPLPTKDVQLTFTEPQASYKPVTNQLQTTHKTKIINNKTENRKQNIEKEESVVLTPSAKATAERMERIRLLYGIGKKNPIVSDRDREKMAKKIIRPKQYKAKISDDPFVNMQEGV